MQKVARAVPVAQVASAKKYHTSAQWQVHTYTPTHTHTHLTLDAKMIHQMLFDQNFNVPWKPIHLNTEPNLITNHGRFCAGRHMFLYRCPALTGLIPFGYVPDLGLFGSRWQLNKFCKISTHLNTIKNCSSWIKQPESFRPWSAQINIQNGTDLIRSWAIISGHWQPRSSWAQCSRDFPVLTVV